MSMRNANPSVSLLLKSVTAFEVVVLFTSGGGLFFLPAVLSEIWPWTLTPFNAVVLGAGYLTAMTPAALLVLIGRWSPARVTVPMILIFTALILVISLLYLDRFVFANPFTWLWFILYVGIPLNAAYHLWRYRTWPPASPAQLSGRWRIYLLAQATLVGGYGLGLLAAPDRFSAFWPWPVDDFHARFYSAGFFTAALGAFLLTRAATWDEVVTVGLTQLFLGLLPILGLVMIDAGVHQVNWVSGATWLWIGGFAMLALTGMGLLQTARRLPRLWTRINEGGLVIPMRYAALVIGIAFTAAGLAFYHSLRHRHPLTPLI